MPKTENPNDERDLQARRDVMDRMIPILRSMRSQRQPLKRS